MFLSSSEQDFWERNEISRFLADIDHFPSPISLRVFPWSFKCKFTHERRAIMIYHSLLVYLTFIYIIFGSLLQYEGRLHVLKAFCSFSIMLWNCLHSDWRKLMKRLCKRQMYKLLLTVLGIEYDYVDVHSGPNLDIEYYLLIHWEWGLYLKISNWDLRLPYRLVITARPRSDIFL